MQKLRFTHVIIDPTSPIRVNYDFIRRSKKFFYYHQNIDESFNQFKFYYPRLLDVFEVLRQKVLNNNVNFSWDTLAKLPYLKKSLQKEGEVRFPITIYNDAVTCGGGRTFVVKNYFPTIALDVIYIYDNTIENIHITRLNFLSDLETELLKKKYIKKKLEENYVMHWHLQDEIILAHDLSNNLANGFPFCTDTNQNVKLISQIKNLIFDTANQDIESVLRLITDLPID